MHSGRLHQVGELVVIAVPPAILEHLGLHAGADVGMAVEGGRLVIEPNTRPRYSLDELLAQCEPSHDDMPPEDRDWLAAPAEGRELLWVERGTIYAVSLDPTSGHEQRGHRPVLIVSATAFNRLTKVPIVVPITSGGAFARNAGFAVSLANTGTKTTGIVRCDQPRALDLDARGARRVESVPPVVMNEVLARLNPIFEV